MAPTTATAKRPPSNAPAGRLVIRYRQRRELKVDPENARKHSRSQLRQIAKSIQSFGFNVPILVDRNDMVVCGHGRLLACEQIGFDEIPTISLEDLTAAQVKGFSIAENRVGDMSSFDERQLALNVKSLAEIEIDFDIEATGFSIGQIDIMIEGLGELDPVDPDDELPAPAAVAISKLGDVWLLGKHRLACGDALEEATYQRLLRGELVQGGFCDPPYGASIAFYLRGSKHREFVAGSGDMADEQLAVFFERACGLAADHSADGAVQFWCIDWRHSAQLLAASSKAFDELLNIAVWAKNNAGMGSLYRSAHEFVLVLKKGRGRHRNNVQLGRFGRNRTNVWNYPGANSFLKSSEEGDLLAEHATPKPVKLVADAILDVTARGELVLDSFLGSGTTLMACERTGRRCRAIEFDPLYVDLAIRRWQRMTGEAAVLEGQDARFNDLATELEAAQ